MNNDILDDDLLDAEDGEKNISYASFNQRLGAALVDMLVFLPLILFTYYNLFTLKSVQVAIICTFVYVLYQPFMEYNYQATLGKMALKIKVVNEQLERANLETILLRNSLYILSAILSSMSLYVMYNDPDFAAINDWTTFMEYTAAQEENSIESYFSWLVIFSCLAVMFTEKKQALHDKLAKTYVILTNR